MPTSKTLVVKLPRNVLQVADFARRVHDSLKENVSLFLSPPVTLAIFMNHIEALAEAEASIKLSPQGVVVRNNAVYLLTSDIKRLAAYVQLLVENSPDSADLFIKASGFSIKQPFPGRNVQGYEVISEEEGKVTLSASANEGKFPYVWEVSADNVNWALFKVSRVSLAENEGALVSGHVYYFRYYMVGEDNMPEPTSTIVSCRVR